MDGASSHEQGQIRFLVHVEGRCSSREADAVASDAVPQIPPGPIGSPLLSYENAGRVNRVRRQPPSTRLHSPRRRISVNHLSAIPETAIQRGTGWIFSEEPYTFSALSFLLFKADQDGQYRLLEVSLAGVS